MKVKHLNENQAKFLDSAETDAVAEFSKKEPKYESASKDHKRITKIRRLNETAEFNFNSAASSGNWPYKMSIKTYVDICDEISQIIDNLDQSRVFAIARDATKLGLNIDEERLYYSPIVTIENNISPEKINQFRSIVMKYSDEQLNEDYLDSAEFRIQRYEDEIPKLFHKVHDGYMNGMVNAKAYADVLAKIYSVLEDLDYADESLEESYMDAEKVNMSKNEAFDMSRGPDLGKLSWQVASYLDADALGEDKWIEFICDDPQETISGKKLMRFEAIGEDAHMYGFIRTNGDAINVQFRNGSEAVCHSPEEIARFIAGEFGISI